MNSARLWITCFLPGAKTFKGYAIISASFVLSWACTTDFKVARNARALVASACPQSSTVLLSQASCGEALLWQTVVPANEAANGNASSAAVSNSRIDFADGRWVAIAARKKHATLFPRSRLRLLSFAAWVTSGLSLIAMLTLTCRVFGFLKTLIRKRSRVQILKCAYRIVSPGPGGLATSLIIGLNRPSRCFVNPVSAITNLPASLCCLRIPAILAHLDPRASSGPTIAIIRTYAADSGPSRGSMPAPRPAITIENSPRATRARPAWMRSRRSPAFRAAE